jgi:hypothetical protein
MWMIVASKEQAMISPAEETSTPAEDFAACAEADEELVPCAGWTCLAKKKMTKQSQF